MRFFHVSDNAGLDGTLIKPRVPISRMWNEDNKTKRICVSPSINGCLTATPRYNEGDMLTVYECWSDQYIQPDENQVIDGVLTGECWILEEVIFKYFITIEVTEILETKLNEMINSLYGFKIVDEEV